MGFMGLDHWCSSDNAADFRGGLLDTMAEALEKELKETANCYNTPGFINVALVMEDKTLFGKIEKHDRSYFYEVAQETIKMLEGAIADPDWANGHRRSLKRMKKNLETWIEGVEHD